MSEPDRLLDIEEAGQYCGGVSRSTIYREHKRGKIRFVKVRGSTRVWLSELDRYLRERVVAA